MLFSICFSQNHRDEIQRKFEALRESCSVSAAVTFCLRFQQQNDFEEVTQGFFEYTVINVH